MNQLITTLQESTPFEYIPAPAPEPRPSPPIQPIEDRIGPGRFPGLRKPFRSLLWCIHVPFGTLCLVLILALLAAIPGLNILTLGYLIEPQKRVAVGGRLRDGFPLLILAPRLGLICLLALIVVIPLRIAAMHVSDAAVILGESHAQVLRMQTYLRIGQTAGAVFILLLITVVGMCGYRFWWIFTSDGRRNIIASVEQIPRVVRPLHHFWIGLKAFFGAVCWLLIPTGLLVAYSAPGRTNPVFGLLSFLGILLLIPVTAWLPLLQVHQAVTGKFRSIFSVSAARQIIRNAPLSWMLTTVLMYAMTFPLYLTKIKLLPADAMLVLTPFFILLTYPARILVAWAYHRGMSRERAAWFPFRWGIKLMMVPLLAGYAGFLFLTPFVSELGKGAPLENQAFLSPVPYAQWGQTRN